MKNIILLLITTLCIGYAYAQGSGADEKYAQLSNGAIADGNTDTNYNASVEGFDSNIGGAKVDPISPPVDLQATLSGADVTLTWLAPGSGGWFGWSEPINDNGIGTANGGAYTVAQRYDSDKLAAYDGMALQKVEIFVRSGGSNVVLKVWTGNDASTLVLSQPITPTVGAFFVTTLNTPILIDASEELWVGYDIVNEGGTSPAGTDAGPAIAGYGDMISIGGGAWTAMSTEYGLDYNFNISCFATEGKSGSDLVEVKDIRTEISTDVELTESSEKGIYDSRGAAALNGYNVYRGGNKINTSLVIETTYIDLDVAAGFHTYTATAVFDDGESDPSNAVEVPIMLNMVEREFVVVEIATGTWCQYCPGAALGADDLIANGKKVVVIEYHGGDSYSTTNSDARISYYPVAGYPTAMFDGATSIGGGNHTQSVYSSYLPIYEECKEVLSAFEITLNGVHNGTSVLVNGTVKCVGTRITDDLVLQVSITESEIAESWQGQSKLDYVSRDMLPNADGTALDFTSTDEISFEFETELDADWNTDHIEFAAFVQANDTKKIKQATKVSYNNLAPASAIALDAFKTSVYPNPATTQLNISAECAIANVEVYTVMGQLVNRVSGEQNRTLTLNTSNYASGIYLVKINSEDAVVTKRILIVE